MADETKAFINYYNQYFDKIYRYIFFRSGRDRELAEDMTSEVFLKALEKYDTFDHKRPFVVWIYRIAHNHIIDFYKKGKHQLVEIDEVIEKELKTEAVAHKELDIKMNLEHINKVLEELPSSQKEIIIMKYINELENEEIANVLGITENHLRVLQHRALGALRAKLSHIKS